MKEEPGLLGGSHFEAMDERQERLLRLLYEKSFRYSKEPAFRLVSGRLSRYYVDCKPTTMHPEGMALIGQLVYERVAHLDMAGIGGLTMGADPIAYAVALHAYHQGKTMKAFVVRKEPKEHGTRRWIEGDVREGERVCIIEDVVTTGQSTIRAIERAREAGLEVVHVVALVDREEDEGRQNILRHNVSFEALFTIKQLMAMHPGESM